MQTYENGEEKMHQNEKTAKANDTEISEKKKCCGRCSSGSHKSAHGKTHGNNAGGIHGAENRNCGMSGSVVSNTADMYRGNVMTDPQGSYTGRPEDITEVPVQDADDL